MVNMIRQPIIVVMGHVDHGKTTLLDKIRSTTVASREVGGITQHIGASEIPIDIINKICGTMIRASNIKVTIPGILFIDTPGHEAFSNLRKRGGSIADIAILVVDITKGFEPQTIEAINILKEYKTPFIVAANKIDLITGWIKQNTYSVIESLQKQNSYVVKEFNDRVYEVIGKMSELGFSADIFNNIDNFTKQIAIIPISAKTSEGLSELLMIITGLAQKYLENKLKIEINGPGKGSILEKKEITGLGTTIDVVLYDGTLHVNDIIAFATTTSITTAKIKALLKPKPLSEIRESSTKFDSVEMVSAACGVKISGNGLDDALPGSPLIQVIGKNYEKEIQTEIGDLFVTDNKGIVLKADSIGSIEAISKLLKSENFNIGKKSIGNITKRDVLDAFSLNASDPLNAIVLGFNVKIDDEAEETVQSSGVKIITSNIIYKLIDDYKLYIDEKKHNIIAKIENSIIFPSIIRLIPNDCFRASNPAIFGIEVISGRIKKDYPLMNENGEVIGKIRELQSEKEKINIAKKGDNVAISVDGPTYGRQIKDNQILYARLTDSDEKLLSGEFSNLLNDEEKELLKKEIEIKRQSKKV
ncbi:MAG: translation initiation factor IF-2 [Candidatus Marsarchaeota archaeon]|nr:translation initiation factor IF-2 [Candidatus Marsarchaeota archaeon]